MWKSRLDTTNSPAMKRGEDKAILDSSITPINVGLKDAGHSDRTEDTDDCGKRRTALRILGCYLRRAFDIEDELVDTTGDKFQAIDRDRISLIHAVQSNIEEQLVKVIALNCLSQVPLKDILRLHRICVEFLKAVETIEIEVDDVSKEHEVEEWLHQVLVSHCGLLSSSICLLLRSGARQEKLQCSENIFRIASNALKITIQTCVIPANRGRSSATSSELLGCFSTAAGSFAALMSQCERLLQLFTTLAGDVKLSEAVLNTLEVTAVLSTFADNSAEKSKFEDLRVAAMDMLLEIFLHYPAQRPGILNEILISLKELSATKLGPRDVKLSKGGNIQLVSILIMRIIQSAARYEPLASSFGDLETDGVKSSSPAVKQRPFKDTSKRARGEKLTATQELSALVSPLLDMAKENATHIVNFIVNRAICSNKTEDESSRNLLYLFVEDFVASLDCPEWPAAELLLRLLLFRMVRLLDGDKTAQWVKNMAIDILGLMGAAISALNPHIRQMAVSNEIQINLGWHPRNMTEASLELKPYFEDLIVWKGPFHACLEFLNRRSSVDLHLHSAVGYLTAQWASKVYATYDSIGNNTHDPKNSKQEYSVLATRLKKMIADRECSPMEFELNCVTASNARMAYILTLLRSQFYESFKRVVEIFLVLMTSPQASIRCRSLKVVQQILEADPIILDHKPLVKTLVSRCANDISMSVRESSLRLISRCIELKPELEEEMMSSILQSVNDGSISIRKRAMKILKEIYLKNSKTDAKSVIAEALLYRIADLDESVRGLARQSIEEIWISPFYQPTLTGNTSAESRLAVTSHVALIAKTIQRNYRLPTVFIEALQAILSNPSKGTAKSVRVCELFVATMFEMSIGSSTIEGDGALDAVATFQALMIFAEASPSVFTATQIELLQPHVAKVGTEDDMRIYRYVVAILHHALPQVPNLDSRFLISVRTDLMRHVTRVSRPILNDVIPCLWIISENLQDIKPLIRLTISCLENIRKIEVVDLHDPSKHETLQRLKKLLLIAGMCGMHCNFDAQLESFRARFTDWSGHSISELMIATFVLFSSPTQPIDLRKSAFEAICMVCQSWPKHFTSVTVYTRFEEAFNEKNSSLEIIILKTFKAFLVAEEQCSEANDGVTTKLGIMGGSQLDGVAAFITQKFASSRKDLMRIALATQGDQALLAIEVLASMSRQGLLHPKECAPMWIALETSQNRKIAELSFNMHQTLHHKFGTIIENEYIQAVEVAYEYQRDVAQNVRGATYNPYISTLHMMIKVMKTGTTKSRKKFYECLCARLDIDLSKTCVSDLSQYLQRSQFIIENMAFFEYASVEELNTAIIAMEKVFTRAGIVLAHTIDTEVLRTTMDHASSSAEESSLCLPVPPVNPIRLQILTAFSMTLSSLWDARTYLRQQYDLPASRCNTNKVSTMDSNKAPIRVSDINGHTFWEKNCMTMAAMDSEQTMLTQCRAFVDLFHEDVDPAMAAIGTHDLSSARLSTTGDKEGGKFTHLEGRKRKAVATRWNRKRRTKHCKGAKQEEEWVGVTDDEYNR